MMTENNKTYEMNEISETTENAESVEFLETEEKTLSDCLSAIETAEESAQTPVDDGFLASQLAEIENLIPSEEPAEESAPTLETLSEEREEIATQLASLEESEESEPATSTTSDPLETAIGNVEEQMEKGEGYYTQKKVREKIAHHIKVLRGGSHINKVVEIALETLKNDGYLEWSIGGNLYQNLLRKPFSANTAKAQAGQIGQMFPALQMCIRDDEKKVLTPKTGSVFLERSLKLI